MSRYRPPQPKSSPYITPAGFARLQAEEKDIWKRRKDVTAALSAAAAEGDRSENAEYIYRKKELAGLDRRIRYLQKRLPVLKVIDAVGDPERVFFGATVELAAEDGTSMTITIVGADEIDPAVSAISIDSPMARALLKKGEEDEIQLQLGDETRHYEVVAIRYGNT